MGDENINAWQGIRENALNGELRFEPEAASGIAISGADMIGGLEALRDVARQVASIGAFSHLPSGIELADTFARKGDDAARILGRHVDILWDMVNAFVAAGRSYAEVENVSAAALDNIESRITARTAPLVVEFGFGQPESGNVQSRSLFSYGSMAPASVMVADVVPGVSPTAATMRTVRDMPEELATATSEDPPKEYRDFEFEESLISLEAEYPEYMQYEDLYNLGRSIADGNSAQVAADKAEAWRWMADKIGVLFSELSNRLNAVANGERLWSGGGIAAAQDAVLRYGRDVAELQRCMRLIGDNLLYTSGWLAVTRDSMPPGPVNPAYSGGSVELDPLDTYPLDGYVADDPTPRYRELMRQTYFTNLPKSAESVPVLPSPHSSAGNNDNGDGGGNGTGGGDGTGTGVGDGALYPITGAGAGTGDGVATDVRTADFGDWGSAPVHAAGSVAGIAQAADRAAAQQAAAAQRSAQKQAAQQAAAAQEQAAQQAASAAQQMAQQAVSAGQQVAQQAAGAAQQMAGAVPRGLPGGAGPSIDTPKAGGLRGVRPGGAGAGAAGAGRGPSLSASPFPRASAAGPAGAGTIARAVAAPAPMAGTPGPASPGGQGAGRDQGKEHKRIRALNRTEHLDEALGPERRTVNPVVQ
ncbi:hypothetical protein AB4305_31810 [Nocardia sp. 2YAB30]|uniref:hypothetical protein n=1 Tax=Nocardia sp. 2YAB30 TaxID=3233022 RepID=UPI003F964E84